VLEKVRSRESKTLENKSKSWICPCNGCKKARKQAFDEVMELIDAGGDAYTKVNNIKKLISEK
jgi:hypothetical protein